MKKILKKAIENLKPCLESKRMALIGFYGGYEGTFRDILATELQKNLRDEIWVITEKFYEDQDSNRRWADIALINLKINNGEPNNKIEIKHNFVNDKAAIERNIEKYQKSEITLIQLVTDIKMPENIRRYLQRRNSETPLEYYQVNCGKDSGQEVNHLHIHLIGGKSLKF